MRSARVHGVHFPAPGPSEGVKIRTIWRNTCRDHPQATSCGASLRTMIARAWISRLMSYQWTRRLHEHQSGALTVCQAMIVAALILRIRQEARKTKLVLWCQMISASCEYAESGSSGLGSVQGLAQCPDLCHGWRYLRGISVTIKTASLR